MLKLSSPMELNILHVFQTPHIGKAEYLTAFHVVIKKRTSTSCCAVLSRSGVSASLQPHGPVHGGLHHGPQPAGLLSPWGSPPWTKPAGLLSPWESPPRTTAGRAPLSMGVSTVDHSRTGSSVHGSLHHGPQLAGLLSPWDPPGSSLHGVSTVDHSRPGSSVHGVSTVDHSRPGSSVPGSSGQDLGAGRQFLLQQPSDHPLFPLLIFITNILGSCI